MNTITAHRLYDSINRQVFDGALPTLPIRFYGARYKKKFDAEGLTWFANDGTISGIEIYRHESDLVIMSVLLHEMVHVWQSLFTSEIAEHGVRFRCKAKKACKILDIDPILVL